MELKLKEKHITTVGVIFIVKFHYELQINLIHMGYFIFKLFEYIIFFT